MADGRKVHPDCVNAANPYHECFEECYMKISNGKSRKGGGNRNSGNRPAGNEIPRGVPKERKVHRGCPNASNPYHECGDHCRQKTGRPEARRSTNRKESGSAAVEASQNMSRRTNKEPNSQAKPTEVLNSAKVPVPPIVAPSSPLNFPSKEREIKEVVPEKESMYSKPLSPSPLYSGELHPEEFSFNKGQVKSFNSSPASGAVTPVLGISPDRRTLKDHLKDSFASIASKEEEEGENYDHVSRELAMEKPVVRNREDSQNPILASLGSSVSEMDRSFEETDDDDDIQSVVSEVRVSVGKYQVKSSLSSTLQGIIEKYGDIAENCLLESVAMRSYYLESVCFMVQELQSTSFMNLSMPKVKEMAAIIKDLEASRLNVGWLRGVLDELSEVAEFISQHQSVKAAKLKCDRSLESTRNEMDLQIEDLTRKEKEVAELKVRAEETKQQLHELEAESAQLDETVASLNSQIDNFHFKTLLQELL